MPFPSNRPHASRPLPNVFTIPAGAPFLATLARALLKGELIPGSPSGGPLDLARATVYLPTRRAAAAFARELVAASGGASLILPRIAPLGAFEQTDSLAFDDPETPRLEAKPAVGELTRRLTLARLTRAWGEALRGAIRRVDAQGRLAFDDSEPALVAASPAQAFALAGDLAALIDDMIIEGVAWERLENLVADGFDPYWRITLDFLKIAVSAWPRWLAEHDLVDRATRAAQAVETEIEILRAGATRGPTIIAGSTGTNRATARLIGACARAPEGAVVLPGLDQDLDDETWTMIGADDESAGAVASHPQAALHRLLARIGIARDEVAMLGAPPPAMRARARFLSQALRPAESTHFWRLERDALGEAAIAEGLADVTLIVADNENEEALALAVAMRHALETPGRTAALITPDPAIARRVAAELARWGIEVENSAGRTLGDAAGGVFARLAVAAALDFAPLPLASLLGHPLTRLGRAPEKMAAQARALELGVLRSILPPGGLAEIDAAFAAARAAAKNRHAHRALRSLGEADFRGAEALLRDLAAALAPLRSTGSRAPLGAFLAAHRAAIAVLAAPDAAASDLEPLDALFDEAVEAAPENFVLNLADYAALFDSLLAGQRAPPEPGGHPRLVMLGLLEARLLDFDSVLLAGLDETVWPPAVETDAFLNRPMRAALGLSTPERRIGQTAHDFAAALGAREAVLSRARKRGGSPTVASRFLQRIGAVAGDAAMRGIEGRGEQWLRLARALDRPDVSQPIRRPEPRPKLELRPNALSVTRIEALRRDPYSVHAESILELQPLQPIGAEAGPSEIGDVWHEALQKFSESFVDLPPDEARARLMAIARAAFAPLLADPAFLALRWPRIVEGLDAFLAFDASRREAASAIFVEKSGRLEIPLSGGSRFTLTARADRIELLHGGGAAVIDYKTGMPPGMLEVQVGFAPQLTLEAAMVARGAFAEIPSEEVVEAIYLKLGGADGGFARALKFNGATFRDVVEDHFSGLKLLLEQFARESTPYLSRPHPKWAGRGADYDHLARVKEWSATGGLDAAAGDAP